jgi:predicted phage terminase large subunit-like protein
MELANTPGWTSHTFRAIERWPTNMPLWSEWEQLYRTVAGLSEAGSAATTDHRPLTTGNSVARAFYDSHRSAMHAGAHLLWPEQEDLYSLMSLRAEIGRSAFDREKQSIPVNPDLCEWPEEYFSDAIWFDTWPADLRLRTIALDPSKGADARRGDYSAFIMLGVGNDGLIYVEADLARRPTPQIITDGVELCARFRPLVFGIESNQFQELLGADFSRELLRQKLIGITPCSIENHLNKLVRIRRLGPLLAARRFRFKSNSPGTRLLVEQLREFPIAAHDDGPDALEMSLRLAETFLHPPPTDNLGSRLV